MKQVDPRTLTQARLFGAAAVIALTVATARSVSVVHLGSRQLADHLVLTLQAEYGRANIFERTVSPHVRRSSLRPALWSAAEQARVKAALAAGARHDWSAARSLAAGSPVAAVRTLIQWRYLLDPTSRPSFRELNDFLTANPGWPRRSSLLLRAETSMPPNGDADYVVNWFGKRQPISGIGQIRLGEAENAVGRSAIGEARIRRAWVENAFGSLTENRILARHGKLFTPQLQQQRLARMLVNDNTAAVGRQLPRVRASAQLAEDAQLLLHPPQTSPRNGASIHSSLGGDPWLLVMVFRLEQQHRPEDALRYLWQAALSNSPLIDHDRLWPEIRTAARDAVADQNYGFAYELASHNGLQSGADYVEAEFLAGWLALEHLKQPQLALKHFSNVRRQATLPATLSRAEYWLGRASDALNDKARALDHYRLAAEKGATFYGQLATVRLSHAPTLRLKAVSVDPSVAKLSLNTDERAAAAYILADVGERDCAREFAMQLVDEQPSLNRFAAVIGLAEDLHDPALSLRVARQAERRNVLLLQYLHPVVPIPVQTAAPSADPAIVLSIIRQESEFDPFAASSAGARGLMQLLPSTAREAAEQQHLRFDAARLGTDGTYNIRLGQGTFASYMRFWSNSTLLAVASYNAGPGTVKKWLATFGDPRTGQIDPVDWIESIPFNETRAYVQRVLAATQVYRNLLRQSTATNAPLTIVADLRDSGLHVSHPALTQQVQFAFK